MREAAAAATRAYVREQADGEGRRLSPSDNASGFRGVSRSPRSSKPFRARVRRNGRDQLVGIFTTPEEGALAISNAEHPAMTPLHANARPHSPPR